MAGLIVEIRDQAKPAAIAFVGVFIKSLGGSAHCRGLEFSRAPVFEAHVAAEPASMIRAARAAIRFAVRKPCADQRGKDLSSRNRPGTRPCLPSSGRLSTPSHYMNPIIPA